MANEKNGYELSRKWWDFCFENPEKIKPNHTALYFFAVEHCNRLGWKEKFGFPTTMAMDAVGIKSYNTFINTLNEIVEWGFIKMVEKSKNQYSANIIALSNFNKALDKALDKALIKHTTKQSESTIQSTGESTIQSTGESTVQSIDSIDKPITSETNETNKPINQLNNIAEASSAEEPKPVDDNLKNKKASTTKSVNAKPKKDVPATTPSVFTECMEIYSRFIKHLGGVPVINSLTGKSLNEIIAALRAITIDKGGGQDKEIVDTFYGLLKGHKRWQIFHQSQTKMNLILFNLQDIIIAVNNQNPTQNGNYAQRKQAGVDEITDYLLSREANG